MKSSEYKITGPYAYENLTVFLIHGSNGANTSRYTVLQAALQQQKVIVHETGSVSELVIENLMEDKDVFVQAGEILRDGRQDRTIRVDVVVPAKSKIPFPTFCVEASRWHRRGPESDASFSSSTHYLATKNLKLAAKMHLNQGAVWNEVAEAQAKLSRSLGAPVQARQSPSSLELTLEHDRVKRSQQDYLKSLQPLLDQHPDSVGFAFAINGQLNSAEVYASHYLFAAFWPKLLESAAVEALAERRVMTSVPAVTEQHVRAMLEQAEAAALQSQQITDRVTVHTRGTEKTILFDTEDNALPGVYLHRHYIFEPFQTASPTYSLVE